MTPFVSIVVPTRNRAEKLRVCLQSLVDQDHPADAYEIIVADDGSTDDTAAVVDSFGPRVLLTRPEGRGSNAARNAGASIARGDPVCFVDDDIAAPPTWLRRMTDGFARYPDAHAFSGPVRVRVEGTRDRGCPLHPVASSFDLGAADARVGSGLGANMAVRRRAADLVDGFDDSILIGGADTEWFDRLRAAGGQIRYVADAEVWHRRTKDDLRLARLVSTAFRRGVASHRYFTVIGRPWIWRNAVRAVPPLLAHAARRRCPGALAGAARNAGYAYGLLRNRGVRIGTASSSR
ncbi:MAG: glycosyl transferase family 2 [Acidimicrobiales bacterium]|nr:glycosyl transferase family 2 [Acidimicrobiales bacterium]